MVEVNDLKGLFQPKCLYNSMISEVLILETQIILFEFFHWVL